MCHASCQDCDLDYVCNDLTCPDDADPDCCAEALRYDSDADGVIDACCPDGSTTIDSDGNGIADACDLPDCDSLEP